MKFGVIVSPYDPRLTKIVWRGVHDTILCDKVCQWLATGRWFSSGTTVSATNKTDYSWSIVESGAFVPCLYGMCNGDLEDQCNHDHMALGFKYIILYYIY